MATSLEPSEKGSQIGNLRSNTYYTVKIGPVDPEIILLKGLLKKEINASRTYSLRGMHMGGATVGCGGDNVPPTFEAKGVQGGTMEMMYSSQFRLYSGVRQGSILFHLLFNIYIDELMPYMNQANGCYANRQQISLYSKLTFACLYPHISKSGGYKKIFPLADVLYPSLLE